ncbi:hypothetical protein K438DRAFT_1988985 [Mycena galopus ATCC 62051]|nr:hypothetical protein K438DRAFT_1988985 [Mycena galopus ATCC 62051]
MRLHLSRCYAIAVLLTGTAQASPAPTVTVTVTAPHVAGLITTNTDFCAIPFGQCGGLHWGGTTCCSADWKCTPINPYYSQCMA